MSGHSKWANIKHKKEKTDAQKGKVFTKLSREIVIAAKMGGADPETNSKLKDAIAKAKASNLPNENIQRSIKKGSGDENSENYEELVYEGYGPGGIAIIVEVLTDNRNRTAGDLRHIFDKFGGNLGTTGCVSFLFEKKGVIIIEKNSSFIEDELSLDAIELGAEDIDIEDDYIEILSDPANFSMLRDGLESKGYKFESADVEMIPNTTAKLEEQKQADSMNKLIENLEDLDDVKNIYHNLEINDI